MTSNYDRNLKMFLNLVAAITLLIGTQAHATDLRVDLKSYSPDENSSENPISVFFTAGTFVITPVLGKYISTNVWSEVEGCDAIGENCAKGWLYSYHAVARSGEFKLLYGKKAHFATGIQAFDAAGIAGFSLSEDSYVDFYIPDIVFTDNQGGISIDISPKDAKGDGITDEGDDL